MPLPLLGLIRKMDPNASPRSRSIFSTLFIPNFKPGVAALGQTTSVFIYMLALLFVANRLFPKDHPALKHGATARLSFYEVIRTAWNNLSFTKRGMPQVLFFFAVVGCIGMVGLTAIVAFCSLFIGRAHAQNLGTMFSAPSPATDLGQQFIYYLFQGQTTNVLDSNTGPSPINSGTVSYVIQCGLYSALGYYSDALLVVAAAILFYHLAWMTVETAHYGQVMGQRGNQIWAPIRLVFAIGLLVPVGGSAPAECGGGGTGLNAAQMIVISVAQWGSGLASNVWQTFLTQLELDSTYQFVSPPPGPVRKIVKDFLDMYACQYTYNWYVIGDDTANMTAMQYSAPTSWGQYVIFEPAANGPGSPSLSTNPGPGGSAPGEMTPFYSLDNAIFFSGTASQHFTFTNIAEKDIPLCGSYILPGAPIYYDPVMPGGVNDAMQGVVNAVYTAQSNALLDLLTNVSALQINGADPQDDVYDEANSDMPLFIQDSPEYLNGDFNLLPDSLDGVDIVGQLASGYEADLMAQIQAAVAGTPADPAIPALAAVSGNQGWVSAGAWFNTVARVQTDLMVAATDGLPKTTSPVVMDPNVIKEYWNKMRALARVGDDSEETPAEYNLDYTVGIAVSKYDAWLTSAASAPPPGTTLQQQMILAANMADSPSDTCSLLRGTPTDCIFGLIDNLAGAYGVWHAVPTSNAKWENLLGVQFTGANPMGEIGEYGDSMLALAYKCFDTGITASFLGGALDGLTAQIPNTPAIGPIRQALNLIGSMGENGGRIMIMIGAIFFALGFTMAYFVPLIPFIAFFFGVIAWIAAMLEGVIMAPLVALAHLNPEGDGLPGDMARGGYFLLFQIFLRPVLMVFGLLAGLLIFYLAVSFLNMTFAIAVGGTGGLSHGHFAAARIFYTVIYVILVLIAANHSFDLIQRLPDMSMQWLGVGGIQGLSGEQVASLEGRLTAVSGIAGQQLAPQIANAASGAGQRLGGAFNPDRNITAPAAAAGNVGPGTGTGH